METGDSKQSFRSKLLSWLFDALAFILLAPFLLLIHLLGDPPSPQPVYDCIVELGQCSRSEIAALLKERKLRIDIDDSLDTLLCRRKIVAVPCEDGSTVYRQPNGEDIAAWWFERLERYGIPPLEEVLDALFTADLNNEGCWGHLEVAFCLKRGNVYFFGKAFASDGRTEVFWHKAKEKKTFASFDEMMDSPFLEGRSIRSLLPDILLTEVNGDLVDSWIEYYLNGNEDYD